LYSDGGIDISQNGKYLFTCAILLSPPMVPCLKRKNTKKYVHSDPRSPASPCEYPDVNYSQETTMSSPHPTLYQPNYNSPEHTIGRHATPEPSRNYNSSLDADQVISTVAPSAPGQSTLPPPLFRIGFASERQNVMRRPRGSSFPPAGRRSDGGNFTIGSNAVPSLLPNATYDTLLEHKESDDNEVIQNSASLLFYDPMKEIPEGTCLICLSHGCARHHTLWIHVGHVPQERLCLYELDLDKKTTCPTLIQSKLLTSK
jgi:hypothetical protein